MPLIINGVEVEHVIFKAPGINQEVDEVYCNSTKVFVSTIFVAKPTISGSFTFDNSAKSPTITGYDSNAMTQSGTASATAAGSYTVTYTPKAGYAWTDGTTSAVSLTWSIAKRKITIPSISNTSKTYNAGAQNPTISGVDASYVTQSGTASATNVGSYTVTWALKYSASTTWTDNTTANKTGSWSIGKLSITIPSISNASKTYNGSSQSPTISNVNSTYVTQSGTASATNAGSYTVTWALNDTNNTQWSDKTTANKSGSWSIGKLSITIPSLSGTTSFAFIEGTTRTVSVSNVNSTYVTQSGTTSASAQNTYTVTWALKNTSNTQWTDNTTANKSANWYITWVNGTSHYTADLYNKGWGSSNIEWRNGSGDTSPTLNSDNITFCMNVFRTKNDYAAGKTFHITLKVDSGSHSVTILDVKGSDWSWTTAVSSTIGTSFTDMSTAHVTGNPGTFGRFGIRSSSSSWKIVIQRIWIT